MLEFINSFGGGFIVGVIFMIALAMLMEYDDNRQTRKARKMRERRQRNGGSGLSL